MGILEHNGWLAFHLVALVVASIATVIDWRTGLIPNWLTFPTVFIPPLVHLTAYGLADGPARGFIPSIVGLLICGLPALFLFRTEHRTSTGEMENVMGGGDVKLFAGIGALVGPYLAITAVAYIIFFAAIIGIGIAARRGGLSTLFRNVGKLLANPFLPKAKKMEVYADHMLMVRLGPAILPGTVAALLYEDWPLLMAYYG